MVGLCVIAVFGLSAPACGGDKPRPLSFREQSVEITSVPEGAVFYLNDIQGSPVATTDRVGQILGSVAYHPYGAVRYQKGRHSDPWGFVGNEEDRGTALSDFHARPYRPELGIFGAVDPEALFHPEKLLGKPRKMLPYAYASADPTDQSDRDGREPTKNQAGTPDGFERELVAQFGKVPSSQREGLLEFTKTGPSHLRRWDFWNSRSVPKYDWANKSDNRFVYTSRGGWMDMAHFLFYAGRAYQDLISGTSRYRALRNALDLGQLQEATDGPVSKHSYEDLPSDYHGAYFAAYVFDPRSKRPLSGQISDYLKSIGATDPTAAPNYKTMPDNYDESFVRGGAKIRNRTYEKAKLE